MRVVFDPLRYEFTNATQLGYQIDPNFSDPNNQWIRYFKIETVPQNQPLQDQFIFNLIVGTEAAASASSTNRSIRFRAQSVNDPGSSELLGSPSFFPNRSLIKGTRFLSNILADSNYDFPAQNLNCSSGIAGGFILDGTLIVDTDYCFIRAYNNFPPPNLDVFLTADSKIIIESGINCNMSYNNIQSCSGGNPWDQIEVKQNATLTMDNSFVSNSLAGITALAGGQINVDENEFNDNDVSINVLSSDASINNNIFNSSLKGIYITGANPIIQSFKSNTFNSLPIGIQVENTQNTPQLDAGSFVNANEFNTCGSGIQINDNGSALVRYNKFIENGTGVKMYNNTAESQIFWNNIGYQSAGITSHFGSFNIADNSIGITGGKGQNGILVVGDHPNSQIKENWIYAENTGVFAILAHNMDVHDNYDINTSTTGGTNTSGVHLFMSDTNVADNYITCNNATAGIWLNGCIIDNVQNTVLHNSITADSGFRTNGIRVEASSDQYVESNITEGKLTRGINVLNSPMNTLDCNELYADNNAIIIEPNSLIQTIRGNGMHAFIDYEVESMTGVQSHHGNMFYGLDPDPNVDDSRVIATQLSVPEFLNSKFEVDPNLSTSGSTNSIYWTANTDPADFFIPIGAPNGTHTCTGNPGPSGFNIPDKDEFCSFLFHSGTTDNSVKINRQHWVLYYLKNVPVSQWPSCLQEYIQNTYCGELLTLSSAQHELQKSFVQNNENKQEQAIRSERLASIRADLKSLSCLDYTFQNYQSVLLDVVHYLEHMELPAERIKELEEIASLCPSENGDAVHWARGLLSIDGDRRYDVADMDCRTQLADGRSETNDTDTEILLYPNPASEMLTVKSHHELKSVDIINSSNHVVANYDTIHKKGLDLNVTHLSEGIYYLLVTDINGLTSIKKMTIIK